MITQHQRAKAEAFLALHLARLTVLLAAGRS